MPIIYNSNFAQSAGAAAAEFKDVNASFRNTMLKLEEQRLRQEENEARRAQAAQFQQDRLGQQQKQFDVQMDFKQQQLAGSRSRVGDQFAPPTGEGMLNLWGSMGELNASAVKDGRELITGEQQAAFGDQMSGLLGRQVTPDTPITSQELENHPNRRAIYRALTGQYNQMSTLDAQQRLTDSFEGTAQSLIESHPEFAQTPAGLAILDEMSSAYADSLQEDQLSPQAGAIEAQAFKRAYLAGASRMEDAANVRSDINKRMIERDIRAGKREKVNDILAQLNDPKSQLTADDVRLQALREFDPDSAAQFEAGQAQAAVDVAAAQAAGIARNAPAPPPEAQVPGGPTTPSKQNAPLPLGSQAERVMSGRTDEQQELLEYLIDNGVEFAFDEEEGQYLPIDQGMFQSTARRYAEQRQEKRSQLDYISNTDRAIRELEAMPTPAAEAPARQPQPGMTRADQQQLVVPEEQRLLRATRADQDARRQMADHRGRAQVIAKEAEKQQIAMEQMLADIAPGSQKLAQVLMQNQIPFELDENSHVIITEELKKALMSDDVQLLKDNQ